jgi:GTP pyrophosphokinase
MRTLSALPEASQRRIAKETMDIYAPLANRLGIGQIKWELEDLSFRYLSAELYKKIARLLNERRVDREKYIENFIAELQAALKAYNIEATVTGRPKHIYSIYRKMSRKEVDYSQIYDVRAARVIVNDAKDCYAALGVVHSTWRYIPGEFDDYIANPKSNDYRSLHTAVIGPEGKTVEVQLRTRDMHQHNEFGVAAHWRYKENYGPNAEFERKIAWLRQLLEWKDELKDASDFVDQVKTDIFQDRVYVFTPKGHVIDLPADSTPLDFAYHIHSELGHRCRGAKVNGRMAPLTYILKTGEQVDLLTIKKGEPSRDWLNPHLGFIHSNKARSHVQRWFKHQNHEQHVAAGRTNLTKELHRLGFVDVNIEKLARSMNFKDADDMFAALARGDIRLGQIVAKIEHTEQQAKAQQDVLPITGKRPSGKEKHGGDVKILGVGNLLTHFARCCKPLPGDDIEGYITKGRGVSIHRSDCQNLMRYKEETPERIIAVNWGDSVENTYPVGVRIIAYDRHGLLRDISSLLANEGVNVLAVNTVSNKKTHRATMALTLEIGNIEKLSRILAKISQLPNILDAHRTNV